MEWKKINGKKIYSIVTPSVVRSAFYFSRVCIFKIRTKARRFFVIRYEENERTATEEKCFISFGVYSIADYFTNYNTFFQFFWFFRISRTLHKNNCIWGLVLYKLPKPPDPNRGPWYFCLTKSKIRFCLTKSKIQSDPVSQIQNFKLRNKLFRPRENLHSARKSCIIFSVRKNKTAIAEKRR